MPSLTFEGALTELGGVENKEQLDKLIGLIDNSFTGKEAVLFSGEHVDETWYGRVADRLTGEQPDVQSIRSTEVGRFLDFDENPDLVGKLREIFGDADPTVAGTDSDKYLNGIVSADGKTKVDGVWDRVSKDFVSQVKGEVHVLVSPQKEFGVFELSELNVLLENPNVTTIEGIDRQILVELAEKNGIADVKHALSGASFARVEISGLLSGNTAKYLETGADDVLSFIQDPANLSTLQQKMGSLSAFGFDNGLRGVQQLRGFIALAEAGTIAAGRSIAPHLNKFGIAGVALSALFAASEAEGASPEEARAIMEEWAVDAIGSEVGSIVAASLATAAAAAFTTLTAPVTIPLVIGASIAGGFFGSDLAASFHAFLNNKDEAAERDMLRKLSELYFGDGTTVTAETIPVQGANFAFIDPALASEAMAQAAKASIAWRYALVELNPFLVPEGPYESIHNINGELDRYDPATGIGLTDEYLGARAEALRTHVRLFEQDERISAGNVYPGGYDVHYLDSEEHGDSSGDGAVVLDLHYTSDYKEQRLFGGNGDDVLTGSTADDMLFGGDGDDLLRGMGGTDYLEGGAGDDTYAVGDGDRIFDHDGIGRVLFDEDPLVGGARDDDTGAYASGDGKYLYTLIGTNLVVQRTEDGAMLTISNFDDGNLGIELEGNEPPPPSNQFQLVGTADSEVIYGRTDPGVTDYEQVNGYNLPDHIQGQEGRDWIYAWDNGMQAIVDGVVVNAAPDSDIVEGGSGKDFVYGGAGDDKLYATVLADAAAVKAGQGSLAYGGPSNDEGDFVSGQSGNDELYGSGRVDGLFGGDGDDLIYGGGGDDVIAADWSAVVSTLSLNTASYDYDWYSFDAEGNRQFNLFGYNGGIGSDRVYAGDGNDLVWGGAADDIIYGEAGNDRLNGDYSGIDVDGNPALPSQYHGNDFLSGGSGDDGINGNGGSDILLGGDGNDYLDGDFRVEIGDDATYHGNDYLDGGKGNDILTGNGGDDVLLGGDDDDALFGDLVGLDASRHGADVLYGGAGNDHLEGQGGDDALYGGTGDDVLFGDATELDIAYHGEDTIHGGDGDDSLAGFGGNDLLYGGKGSDRYEFSTGDGLDTIVDTDGGLNGDSLDFFGIGAVTLTLEAGDLHAKVGDEGFVFKNWDPSQFGGIHYHDSEGGFIGGQTASDVVSVANRAPTVVDATSSVRILEDQPLSVSLGGVGFADANGDSLKVSATLADGNPLPGWLQFNADSLLLSGLPGNEAVGTHSILITAEDAYGGSVSHTLSLEINNLNDAPELVAPLPERSVTAGFDFEHDLSGYWTDPDVDDELTYSASLENGDPLPGWLSFDAGSLILAGSAPQDATGDLTIRTLARDGSGAETSASYTLRFRSVSESMETSQLTLGQLSVPDPSAYFAFYMDRQYFEWQNGVVGDINGDGYDDYYFGTDTVGHALDKDRFRDRLGNPVEDNSAIVQIVYGEAGGWSGAPPRTTSFMLGSDSAFDQLGLPDSGVSEVLLDAYRFAPLGDANKDGFDDFALGDRMFWGSAAGLGESFVWEDIAQQPLLDPSDTVDFSSAVREFTVMLGGLEQVVQAVNVGDINGDGIDDYVTPVNVSTYGTAFGAGFPLDQPPQQAPVEVEDELRINVMHVLYGRSGGQSGVVDLDQLPMEQGYAIQGFERFIETGEYSGTVYDVNQVTYGALVSGGDIDGDGLNDIMISTLAGLENSMQLNGTKFDEYSVRNYLLFGSSEPVSGIDLASMLNSQGLIQEYLPVRTEYGSQRIPGLIELGGDINGDGFDDAVSVTGDYAEADYGGRVDLEVLYGNDIRNNAAFTGSDENDDQVVVTKDGVVYTLGGNDSVLARPGVGPHRYEINTGAGDDTIEIALPDNANQSGGTHAYLQGGDGNDIYKVRTTSSMLGGGGGTRIPRNTIVINDRSSPGSSRGSNTLVVGFGSGGGTGVSMPTLGFGSLKLSFDELDLSIHLENFDKNRVLEGPRDVDFFDFGNGQVVTYEELVAQGFDLDGSESDDVIEGSSVTDRIMGLTGADILSGNRGDDELAGGAGDDVLNGGSGNDIYRFNQGDGVDRITDPQGIDRIVFGEGLELTSATVSRIGDDLELSFNSQDKLLLNDWFGANARFLEDFSFFGGVSRTAEEIEQLLRASGLVLVGTGSSETLTGSDGADEIHGHRGNDKILGGAGNDLIVGGDGWDRLYGGSGDDTFSVSPGDDFDYIQGGEGNDRIIGSDGDDAIGLHRNFSVKNSIELIDGGAGYNVIKGSSSSNRLDFSSTTLNGIAEIQGGRGNDTITGTGGDDVIVGGDGWDRLYGGSGDDTFSVSPGDDFDYIQGGEGNDRIIGSDGDDAIGLHRNFSVKNSIELIDGGAGYNVIKGSSSSNRLDFSSTALSGIAELRGGRGNDTITGTGGDDVIVGGDGRDRLQGGAGNDTYLFRRGHDKDIIRDSSGEDDQLILQDVDHDQAWFSRNGDDLVVSVIGANDQVRIDGWFSGPSEKLERIRSADGKFLADSSVEQLVSAMAAFNPSQSGISDGTVQVTESLRLEITAAWQAS